MDLIKIEKLTKYYGTSRGVVNIDLNVKKGDFFGFIGPNGAGKSTTINTILGLISPTSGNVLVFGKDIKKQKTEILKDIGYLPSETMFYNNMKVIDILKMSQDLHKKDCTDETKSLCRRLNLDTSKKINELSLGNRKKVGIVCALQHKPSLYIFDEPTSGLDPLIQREFYAILNERSKEGATIFLSSHVLSEVQKYCKKAAIIKDGKILKIGTVDELGDARAKHVVLHGVVDAPKIDGVKNVVCLDNGVEFLYSGNINILLKTLESFDLNDISITESNLEDVFLHYYTEEEN